MQWIGTFLFLQAVSSSVSQNVLESDAGSLKSESQTTFKKQVYYQRLGFFENTSPWRSEIRPIPAPEDPELVGTRVFFYCLDNPNKYTEILLDPNVDLNGANYISSKKTYFISHGFDSSSNDSWVGELKDALLEREDANVFVVDWSKGSMQTNYFQAASDTRIVGREIERLIRNASMDLNSLHLIGHSLGAQVMGEVGRRFGGKVAIITGLDPAQPGFEGYDPIVHLDITDAVFVISVKTAGRPFIPTVGYGVMAPVGHITFNMNGGRTQPGCLLIAEAGDVKSAVVNFANITTFPKEVYETGMCDHGRAHTYYIEAVANPNCTYWGRNIAKDTVADNAIDGVTLGATSNATEGKLPPCDKSTCVAMGLDTQESSLRGSFNVITHGGAPFCTN